MEANTEYKKWAKELESSPKYNLTASIGSLAGGSIMLAVGINIAVRHGDPTAIVAFSTSGIAYWLFYKHLKIYNILKKTLPTPQESTYQSATNLEKIVRDNR